MRIGIGIDIHAFQKDRKLFLGGVQIPFEKGLSGHSDADVILHAICDAMLGGLALGDIGQMFPNTDRTLKNISSLYLLKKVNQKIISNGYGVINIDTMVLAEKPKLAPHISLMRKTIGKALDISTSSISIKATTSEKIGYIGRGEGIAAHAICLLDKI